LLRTTVATFAAGVGGADSVVVLPFTQALGLPDRHARRLARNTQLVLIEEASVAKVGDPTAGSGAIEDLTTSLCETAWQKFQGIEKAGGAWKALQAGLIQRDVAAVRAEHIKAIARGRDALTGTSAFPNIGEEPVAVLDAQPLAPPAHGPVEVTVEALPAMRLAEPFEALRDAADKMLAQTGSRPKIFLANLGTPSDFTARATFAKNFFESGGIEAVTNDGFAKDGVTDLAQLATAYKASGAPLACISSSDKLYAAEAIAAARALASAGATQIYLAGRPGDLEAALKAANVNDFIYAGCDILATLGAAHDKLATKLSGRP
jgi:methylmalonyl-CoA mutase